MTTTDFTGYFRSLVAALGAEPGWYGAFAARRPGTARAFEAGAELPPWDVVHTVLHDAAAAHGVAPGPAELARARALHRAATTAWDAAPGAGPALRARLDAAVREEQEAARREHEAAVRAQAAAPTSAIGARLAALHAWTRDDHLRAAARRAELHTRLLSLEQAPDVASVAADRPERPGLAEGDPVSGAVGRRQAGPAWGEGSAGAAGAGAGPDTEGGSGEAPGPHSRPGRSDGDRPAGQAAGRRERPRGARFFAGTYDDAPGAPSPSPSPAAAAAAAAAAAPAQDVAHGPAPRGARFAGAPRTAGAGTDGTPVVPASPAPRGARFAGASTTASPAAEPPRDPRWSAEARAVVARLTKSRAAGEGSGVYVELCRAAVGPAERLPYLVGELERAGYAADVATLLWEVAALPAQALASAARAVAEHGRNAECRTLLQQAVSRPAEDIAVVAAALPDADRTALLAALVRTRPAQAVADVARLRPELAGPLLTAAAAISTSRRHDVTAAFHRAGLLPA